MAVAVSKKDKLIEEAQRLVLRGQMDKAVEAYRQIVSLEPSALNHRQKLAELLVKAGRGTEARSEFEAIGTFYSSHGFYLKAIAVYKQLQKLFPQDIAITMTLAGLNEQHGLVGNALAEYKQAYDYYDKLPNAEEALKVLARMQNIDPGNISIKLKLGEACLQAGKKEESYAVFVRLAALLQERGDGAALVKLNARIQQLFPEKTGFMLEVLTDQVENGNAASAVTGIQALLRSNPHDRRSWDLMVAAYKKLNQPQRAKFAFQHYLKFFPDDAAPKQGLLECLVAERNVKEALAQLDLYEQAFMDAGDAAFLARIYKGLDEIDPVNVRVLEGLRRALEAVGDTPGAEALGPRLASFKAISAKSAGDGVPVASREQPAGSDRFGGKESTAPEKPETAQDDGTGGKPGVELSAVPEPAKGSPSMVREVLDYPDEDELEIEIEIDGTAGFESVEANIEPTGFLADDWLDSVSVVFDSISLSPGGVKFGSDLDNADASSHYDLGVSFREMGLYDDAIREFRCAGEDPALKMKCLVLQGACLRDKGDATTSESVLRSLLKPGLSVEDTTQASTGRRVVLVSLLKPGLNLEETLWIKHELALTCNLLGKTDEADKLLAEIDAVSPHFRARRSHPDGVGRDAALEFSDDDLRGFDLK